jgi:diguanylate cyclase (GGDEF)-like protein/PAS domain S-box-containing protein
MDTRHVMADAPREIGTYFLSMFERVADAWMMLDVEQHRFVNCNQAAVDMLRCRDRGEILAMHPADLSPPLQPDGRASADKAEEMIASALRTGSRRFEWVHCSPHRANFPVEVLLTPVVVEGSELLLATLRDITEFKRAEETLRESEQSYIGLFNSVDEAIYVQSPDGAFLDVNEGAAKMFGYQREQFKGRTVEFLSAPGMNDLSNIRDLMDQVFATGIPQRFDLWGVRGNGDVFPKDVVCSKGYYFGQAVLITTARDSTDRRRAEKTQKALYDISEAAHSTETLDELFLRIHQVIGELLPARNFFVALYDERKDALTFPYFVDEFDSAPVGAMKLDDSMLSARLIRLGEALLFTPETPRVGIHEEVSISGTDSLDWLGVPLKSQSRTIGALVVQSYSGDVRYTQTHRALLEFVSGQVAAAIERKQTQEALLESEARLEEAQRISHLGSWDWDLATDVLTWSDELCRIYGVEPGHHAASFDDWLSRLHPEDRDAAKKTVADALAKRASVSHEMRIIKPNGEIRTLFDQAEVRVDQQGRALNVIGACLDITERKLEERLEKDRSLVLELVAQNEPMPEILARIIGMIEAQIPGARSSIVLIEDGRLSDGFAPNLPKSYTDSLMGLPIGPGVGCCGTACFTGEVVVTENIATDPLWDDYRHLALPHGLRACWSMPISSNETGVLGSFAIYHDYPCRPSARDLEFMATTSRLAAVAIEHRLLTDQLAHQAQHDALTGLPNRLLFQDRLHQALVVAERKHQQVAVLYMDLDRFKHINDTMGHSSGDALLCEAASRLQVCIRKSDTLARLGGDEFIVVVTELREAQDAMRVATKLIEALRVPFMVDGQELFVSVSLGISIYPDDGLSGEILMANADAAMYRAKEKGRDNFQWFASEMTVLAKERMSLESQLRRALELGQLSLHYQPQCNASGQIHGFEALMRWEHPTLGMVPPNRFIPLAEESGLIIPMGEWALREACAQARAWHEAGHPFLRMSVNVSAVQFRRSDWVDTVRRALRDTGLAPDALELEITESLLLQSISETSTNLFELRKLGVGVAIDDFGTGYSSLSYLHKLPVTTLKIDQSFVREIGEASMDGQEDAPIIRTIIALAHNFGMSVVAEGVETEAQRKLLVRLGCESLQGYLLHRPLTVQQAEAVLKSASSIATRPAAIKKIS